MRFLKILLLFFLTFNFPIPIVYNSAVLTIFIATALYLCRPKLLNEVFHVFRNKFVVRLVIICLILIMISFLPGLLHFTFDFTIIKGYILFFFLLLSSIYVYPILILNVENSEIFDHVLYLLITVFFIQSCIEIFAFVNPEIKRLVEFFQKESVSAKDMGGIRALALTGNPFFDLAAGFGLIFIVFIYSLLNKKSNSDFFSLKSSLIFLTLFIGSFFAGRTAFVGLAIALGLYFISFGSRVRKFWNFMRLLLFISVGAFVLYQIVLPDETKDIVENQLLPYAFEAVYAYMDGGDASTKSGEVLEEMYFPISLLTFFIGDGHYTGDDGNYYMHTDAGIMRNVLFYGIFGLTFIFFGHLFYFFQPFKKVIYQLHNRLTIRDINDFIFFMFVLIYTFILQYKGEVLLYMPIIQVMLFYICFAFVNKSKEV